MSPPLSWKMGERKWRVRKCKGHSLAGSSRPHVAINKAVPDWMDLIKAPNNIFRDDCTKSQHGKLWSSMIACPLKHKAAAGAAGSYPHVILIQLPVGTVQPTESTLWKNVVGLEDWEEEEGEELVYSRVNVPRRSRTQEEHRHGRENWKPAYRPTFKVRCGMSGLIYGFCIGEI